MFKNTILKVFLVATIIFYGFLLRTYMYQYFPFSGASDELYSVWNGLSLINEKIPASWSEYPVYKKENIIFEGWVEGKWENGNHARYRIVKPWFDHFPLFSLIVGANAKFFNLKNFSILPTGIIRLPMLLIGLVNLFLLFITANKLFKFNTATLSLLVYATAPIIIFSSRMISCENLLTTFEILIVFFLFKYLNKGDKIDLFLVYLFLFFSFLTKGTAIFFGLSVFLILLLYKKNKQAIIVILPIFIAGLLMLLYGLYYDGSLFLKVMRWSTIRGVGLSTVALYFLKPMVVNDIFFDGWFYFGFISLLISFFKYNFKKDKAITIIIVFFISWIIGLIFTSSETDLIGWYRFPLFPLMAMAGGKLLVDFIKEENVLGLFFSFIFLLTGFTIAKIPITGELIKGTILFTVLITALFLYKNRKPKLLIRVFYILILSFMVIGNSLAVINYYKKECENKECNVPLKSNIKIKIPGWKTVAL